MYLRGYSIFCCLAEYLLRVFHGEESCIAEYVHEVGETFFGDSWQHLVADEVYIFRLASLVCASDCVCAEEVGLHCDRSGLLDASDDAQHLELVLHGQAVSALDFHGSGAHGHDFAYTHHGLLIELVFGGRVQKVGGIEDSAASGSDLFIRESGDLVAEFTVSASGIYNMSMRVTESRHHKSALCVDELDVSAGTVIPTGRCKWRNDRRTIFSDDAVFGHEICIFHAFHVIHLRALKPSDISRENARQRPYIVYDGLHELIL